MNFLFSRLDKNPYLARLLAFVSTTLAVQRGLPMLAGTVLVVLSCLASVILLPLVVAITEASGWWLLLLIPALLLHLGVIVAFIGFMMAAPLGKGYHE